MKNQQRDFAPERGKGDSFNLRVTLWLTLALFLMMICAGAASSYLGYIMGQEALKAVTQPEVNSDRQRPLGGDYKGLKIINEKEILVKVYNRIHGKNRQSKLEQSSSAGRVNLVDDEPQSKSVDANFPISYQSQGVTLEVSNAEVRDSSLLLGLNLKNESEQSVRFLYGFLDVRDDRGRPLSAIIEGLPGKIPANSQNFQGTLRIPRVLLDGAKTVSLTLTDYPEQNLELKLQQIPILR